MRRALSEPLPALDTAQGAGLLALIGTARGARMVAVPAPCFALPACCLLNSVFLPACLPCFLQELSMWLYALTLLRLTPSPSWCAAFVEASFSRFTAPATRPQVSQHTATVVVGWAEAPRSLAMRLPLLARLYLACGMQTVSRWTLLLQHNSQQGVAGVAGALSTDRSKLHVFACLPVVCRTLSRLCGPSAGWAGARPCCTGGASWKQRGSALSALGHRTSQTASRQVRRERGGGVLHDFDCRVLDVCVRRSVSGLVASCADCAVHSRVCCVVCAVCAHAAAAVDTTCVSDAWLSAFLKASQTRLAAFEPVQLAHTANALTILRKSHPSAHRLLTAAWQTAFVGAAAKHLAAGRFSLRNLVLVVTSVRLLRFKPSPDVSGFLTKAELVLAKMWPKEARQQQQLDGLQLDTQQHAAL